MVIEKWRRGDNEERPKKGLGGGTSGACRCSIRASEGRTRAIPSVRVYCSLLHRDREVMATGVNITVQPVGMSPSQ